MATARVYGLANGTEVIFSHAQGDAWEIPVPWTEDGKYIVEIFAEDEAGNTSHVCKVMFVISGHEIRAYVMDMGENETVGTGKYHAELIERGYEIERCVCSRSPV